MIRFDNVTKRYDGAREALTGVSLEVAAGELVFLTGRSGAGKSTVLKLIALIEHPTRGTVTVDGRNLGKLRDREIPGHRQQIGMVFQDNKLLGDRSAYENVALPLIINGTSQREIGRRVPKSEEVDRLARYFGVTPMEPQQLREAGENALLARSRR